jgi:predicted O-methyltransferase YrrM
VSGRDQIVPAELEAEWAMVDEYIEDLFIRPDPELDRVLAASRDAGLPQIQVAANQGKMLMLLARIAGARRILEIGTLGGYSTTWLARALPEDGSLLSLEYEPRHAEVALRNLAHAGLAGKADVRVGPAGHSLRELIVAGTPSFDFVFIDADKPGYPDYFEQSVQLCRPGSVIVADNVVRAGKVAHADSEDPLVQGVRRFAELVAAEPRVSATIIQTVGNKGYDGFLLATVNG